jgi:PAS domain-containing protein
MEHYAPAFAKRNSYFIPSVRLKQHDGQYRWHAFKGNPRYLPNGDFNGYVSVGFDIHEQKLAEEAIKQSEAQLQIKVAERTLELENQKNLFDNILKNSSNGISVTEMIRDQRGKVIDAATVLANDAAIRYIGLPIDIYLTKTAVELDPNILTSV